MASSTPIHRLGENLPPEIPGDFFDRQRRVPGFNQAEIEAQVALVLGTGGIGSTVALALTRLGVSKVFLVDRDTVEASNVNRQVLFTTGDVGRRKVDAAAAGLVPHTIRTTVVPVHLDAVAEWARVVAMARESTVVFNAIDHGEYFDYAVTSLCKALRLPYATASSYAHTAIAEGFSGREEDACWACNAALKNVSVLAALSPDKVAGLATLDVIKPHQVAGVPARAVGSSILPCSLAAQMTVAGWLNRRFGMPVPNWSSLSLADLSLFSYPVEPNAACLVCVGARAMRADTASAALAPAASST